MRISHEYEVIKMKRITLPIPVSVVLPGPDGKPALHKLDVPQYLAQTVWPAPYRRDGSRDKLRAVVRLAVAFEGRAPADTIELTNRDYELLLECALVRQHELNQQLAIPVLTLLCALVEADDVTEAKAAE